MQSQHQSLPKNVLTQKCSIFTLGSYSASLGESSNPIQQSQEKNELDKWKFGHSWSVHVAVIVNECRGTGYL